MQAWTVTAQESGTKLLAFVKARMGEGYSAKQLKRAIESNLCQVNGRTERFATAVLGKGDKVVIHLEAAPKKESTDLSQRVLYEDDDLLILNKPAGISSEGKEVKALGLEVCHRLDKETTGALIFAKSLEVRDQIFNLFRKHEVEKQYLAIVDGVPTKKSGVIDNFLGKLHAYQGQTLWGEVSPEKGLKAYTEWELVKGGKDASLVRCFPKTGRTHQIRVHMSGLGHAILGDHQYGRKFRCTFRPGRIMLHAAKVVFPHPVTSNPVSVDAPLPDDFHEALKALGLEANF